MEETDISILRYHVIAGILLLSMGIHMWLTHTGMIHFTMITGMDLPVCISTSDGVDLLILIMHHSAMDGTIHICIQAHIMADGIITGCMIITYQGMQ